MMNSELPFDRNETIILAAISEVGCVVIFLRLFSVELSIDCF